MTTELERLLALERQPELEQLARLSIEAIDTLLEMPGWNFRPSRWRRFRSWVARLFS
jgi:hypothetical protein